MTRRRTRGNVAIIFALTLIVLLGFLALVLDFGNFWRIRAELQNAADGAALGGVRDLNGSADMFPVARASAQRLAHAHLADGFPVDLQLNGGNAVPGDIVLGRWNYTTRVFTPDDGSMAPYRVNAVKVRTRRVAEEGTAVKTFLASLFGLDTQDLVTTAVAVGGSPNGTCAMPLAVTDCSILGADGNIRCNQKLTFGQATTDTVGFTLLSADNPTTPTVTCMIFRQLGGVGCPNNCDCSVLCNQSSTDDGYIKISNGNNLSQTSVDAINAAVEATGGVGFHVQVPVIDSGGLSPADCASFNYNQLREIAGYIDMTITGASFSPNKAVYAEITCTESGPARPAGSFYGFKAENVYLAQ